VSAEAALAHARLIGQDRKRKISGQMAVDPVVKRAKPVVGIARIGGSKPGAFDTLMDNKATVASVLSQRLIPVYTDQPAGDRKEAVTQFEQSLLSQLSNAYATAAVAQIPLTVTVAGTAEAGAALPPRLYGGMKTGAPPPGGAPFTLTSPKLALDWGAVSEPWLTFLVTVKQPEKQSILTLNPVWTISHIEHDFEPGEKLYGYLPSGWLKFVSPDADPGSPLDVSLAEVDVPVPLRRYPASPVLVNQSTARPPAARLAAVTSDDPIQDMIRAALHADHPQGRAGGTGRFVGHFNVQPTNRPAADHHRQPRIADGAHRGAAEVPGRFRQRRPAPDATGRVRHEGHQTDRHPGGASGRCHCRPQCAAHDSGRTPSGEAGLGAALRRCL
jgi:hypothetical protein